MSKRKHPDPPITDPTPTPTLYESTPIHDRASTFRAIFTPDPTTSPKLLQRHAPFATAMHKIAAWRKPSTQTSLSLGTSSSQRVGRVCETGSDEDGEKYAGKKLERVLEEMGVVGVVVVARWYGGVLLGPVRFKWIEDCAREAVGRWKRDAGYGGQGDGVKKVKVDEPVEVERLVRLLKERDASVEVLRSLLAEKNEELKRLEGVSDEEEVKDLDGAGIQSDKLKSPAAAVPDYASMTLQRLRQLEKARDATLGWILKQIDSVEDKVKAFDVQKVSKTGHSNDDINDKRVEG